MAETSWLKEFLRNRVEKDIKPAADIYRSTAELVREYPALAPLTSFILGVQGLMYAADLPSKYFSRPFMGAYARFRAEKYQDDLDRWWELPKRVNPETGQVEYRVPDWLADNSPIVTIIKQHLRRAVPNIEDAPWLGDKVAEPWLTYEQLQQLRSTMAGVREGAQAGESYTESYRRVESDSFLGQMVDEATTDPTIFLTGAFGKSAQLLRIGGQALRLSRAGRAARLATESGKVVNTTDPLWRQSVRYADRLLDAGLAVAQRTTEALGWTARQAHLASHTYDQLVGIPMYAAIRSLAWVGRKTGLTRLGAVGRKLLEYTRLVRAIEQWRQAGMSSYVLHESTDQVPVGATDNLLLFERADGQPLTDEDRKLIYYGIDQGQWGMVVEEIQDEPHRLILRIETTNHRAQELVDLMVQEIVSRQGGPPGSAPPSSTPPGSGPGGGPTVIQSPQDLTRLVPAGPVGRRTELVQGLAVVNRRTGQRFWVHQPGGTQSSGEVTLIDIGGKPRVYKESYVRRHFSLLAEREEEVAAAPLRQEADLTPEPEVTVEPEPLETYQPAEPEALPQDRITWFPVGPRLQEALARRARVRRLDDPAEFWWTNRYPDADRVPDEAPMVPEELQSGLLQSPTRLLVPGGEGTYLAFRPAFANPVPDLGRAAGPLPGETPATADWRLVRETAVQIADAFDYLYLDRGERLPEVGAPVEWYLTGPDLPAGIGVRPLYRQPDLEVWRVGYGDKQFSVYFLPFQPPTIDRHLGLVLVRQTDLAGKPLGTDQLYYHRQVWNQPEEAVRAAATDFFEELVETRLASLSRLRQDALTLKLQAQARDIPPDREALLQLAEALFPHTKLAYRKALVEAATAPRSVLAEPVPLLVRPDHIGFRLAKAAPNEHEQRLWQHRLIPADEAERIRLARQLEERARILLGLEEAPAAAPTREELADGPPERVEPDLQEEVRPPESVPEPAAPAEAESPAPPDTQPEPEVEPERIPGQDGQAEPVDQEVATPSEPGPAEADTAAEPAVQPEEVERPTVTRADEQPESIQAIAEHNRQIRDSRLVKGTLKRLRKPTEAQVEAARQRWRRIGTSIGWAIVDLEDAGDPTRMLDILHAMGYVTVPLGRMRRGLALPVLERNQVQIIEIDPALGTRRELVEQVLRQYLIDEGSLAEVEKKALDEGIRGVRVRLRSQGRTIDPTEPVADWMREPQGIMERIAAGEVDPEVLLAGVGGRTFELADAAYYLGRRYTGPWRDRPHPDEVEQLLDELFNQGGFGRYRFTVWNGGRTSQGDYQAPYIQATIVPKGANDKVAERAIAYFRDPQRGGTPMRFLTDPTGKSSEGPPVYISLNGTTITLTDLTPDGFASFFHTLSRFGINDDNPLPRRQRNYRGIRRDLAILRYFAGEVTEAAERGKLAWDLEGVIPEPEEWLALLERRQTPEEILAERAGMDPSTGLRTSDLARAGLLGEVVDTQGGAVDTGDPTKVGLGADIETIQHIGLRVRPEPRVEELNLEALARSRSARLLDRPPSSAQLTTLAGRAAVDWLDQLTGGRLLPSLAAAAQGQLGPLVDSLMAVGARLRVSPTGPALDLGGRLVHFPPEGYTRPAPLSILRELGLRLSPEAEQDLLEQVARAAGRRVPEQEPAALAAYAQHHLAEAMEALQREAGSREGIEAPDVAEVVAAIRLAADGDLWPLARVVRYLGYQVQRYLADGGVALVPVEVVTHRPVPEVPASLSPDVALIRPRGQQASLELRSTEEYLGADPEALMTQTTVAEDAPAPTMTRPTPEQEALLEEVGPDLERLLEEFEQALAREREQHIATRMRLEPVVADLEREIEVLSGLTGRSEQPGVVDTTSLSLEAAQQKLDETQASLNQVRRRLADLGEPELVSRAMRRALELAGQARAGLSPQAAAQELSIAMHGVLSADDILALAPRLFRSHVVRAPAVERPMLVFDTPRQLATDLLTELLGPTTRRSAYLQALIEAEPVRLADPPAPEGLPPGVDWGDLSWDGVVRQTEPIPPARPLTPNDQLRQGMGLEHASTGQRATVVERELVRSATGDGRPQWWRVTLRLDDGTLLTLPESEVRAQYLLSTRLPEGVRQLGELIEAKRTMAARFAAEGRSDPEVPTMTAWDSTIQEQPGTYRALDALWQDYLDLVDRLTGGTHQVGTYRARTDLAEAIVALTRGDPEVLARWFQETFGLDQAKLIEDEYGLGVILPDGDLAHFDVEARPRQLLTQLEETVLRLGFVPRFEDRVGLLERIGRRVQAGIRPGVDRPLRVLVTGDRSYAHPERVRQAIEMLPERSVVIHGAATGADTQAGQAARDRGLEVQEFPADWKRLGRSAGQVRNRRMFDATQPDLVIAFHDDLSQSRGTRGMVDYARARGVEVYLIASEEDLAGLPEVLRRVAAEAELPEGVTKRPPTEPTWVSTFSNFRPRPLTYEGETYPTAEHLYQALKFKDPEVRAQIRAVQNPKEAKALAHRLLKTKPEAVVEGYTQNSEMSLDLMRRVLRIRAEQDAGFRQALLQSEGPIAEPRQDPFWGRGGENWMGRLLEELREELKHPDVPPPLPEGVTRVVPATSRPAGVPGDHPLVEPELGPAQAQALARSLLAAGEGSGTRATLRELAAARFADEYLRLARRALEPLKIRVGQRAELSEASTYYQPVVETARERVDQGLSFDRPLLESDPLWAEEPRLPGELETLPQGAERFASTERRFQDAWHFRLLEGPGDGITIEYNANLGSLRSVAERLILEAEQVNQLQQSFVEQLAREVIEELMPQLEEMGSVGREAALRAGERTAHLLTGEPELAELRQALLTKINQILGDLCGRMG